MQEPLNSAKQYGNIPTNERHKAFEINLRRIKMTKKQYTIIGITILIFIILIAFILIKGNKSSWTKEILNSNSYTITKIDCDNNKTKLDNSIMKKIDSTWKELSNNGPWLGDTNTCYETISIEYDKNGIIQKREILILDNNSIVLRINNDDTYYVNATNLINSLK